MVDWIKYRRKKLTYIGTYTRFGFLPIACPNCKDIMEVKDTVYKLGYYRHKKCWERKW